MTTNGLLPLNLQFFADEGAGEAGAAGAEGTDQNGDEGVDSKANEQHHPI